MLSSPRAVFGRAARHLMPSSLRRLSTVAQQLLRAIVPGGEKTLFNSTPVLQEGHLLQFALNQLGTATDKPGMIVKHWKLDER